MKEKHYAVSNWKIPYKIIKEREDGYMVWTSSGRNNFVIKRLDIAYTVTIKSWKK